MVDSAPARHGAAGEDEPDPSAGRGASDDSARPSDARDDDLQAEAVALGAQLDPVPKKVVDAARRAWQRRHPKAKDARPDA